MPYLNGLASKYGLATQYYADVHPSIGNYFMLTTGQIETIDDAFQGIVSDDNIVREMVKAARDRGLKVVPIPGPSAITAALGQSPATAVWTGA